MEYTGQQRVSVCMCVCIYTDLQQCIHTRTWVCMFVYVRETGREIILELKLFLVRKQSLKFLYFYNPGCNPGCQELFFFFFRNPSLFWNIKIIMGDWLFFHQGQHKRQRGQGGGLWGGASGDRVHKWFKISGWAWVSGWIMGLQRLSQFSLRNPLS